MTSTVSDSSRGLHGTLIATLVELLLLTLYVSQDAAYHWLVHFLTSGTAALTGLTATAACRHRPATQPTLWVLLCHLIAIFPDLLFAAGIAHQRWILGHVSSHNLPGGPWTLYGSFLAGLALYLLTIARLPPRGAIRSGAVPVMPGSAALLRPARSIRAPREFPGRPSSRSSSGHHLYDSEAELYDSGMATMSISDARNHLPDAMETARTEAVFVQRRGRLAGVLVSPERYEQLMTALEDTEDIAAFDAAIAEKGPNIPWEQVKADLGWE